ncbi:MAG: transposase [Cyanobacteria bacterium J083]|nr:MAG: transposase [Cyanobacteria bacterium J083]
MSPKKLSDSDKKQILELYRQSNATTSTLADQFKVSSSTISRFLKHSLSQDEYEDLIQQKRLARSGNRSQTTPQETVSAKTEAKKSKKKLTKKRKSTESIKLSEKRTKKVQKPSQLNLEIESTETSVETEELSNNISEVSPQVPTQMSTPEPINLSPRGEEIEEEDEITDIDVASLAEMLGEDIATDEEDLEDELEDEEEELTYSSYESQKLTGDILDILPLTKASLPRTCYLVIDKSAELITRPLKEFTDLGTIPQAEVSQKTLPVFDNHRVAKRFSHRRERVIKVPDGKLLQKTANYLLAKGIDRLLIDGKIYSLSSADS